MFLSNNHLFNLFQKQMTQQILLSFNMLRKNKVKTSFICSEVPAWFRFFLHYQSLPLPCFHLLSVFQTEEACGFSLFQHATILFPQSGASCISVFLFLLLWRTQLIKNHFVKKAFFDSSDLEQIPQNMLSHTAFCVSSA